VGLALSDDLKVTLAVA